MNLENISENLKNLPDDQEKSILALIDHKVESEMEKVLNKFDVIKESMQAKMESMQFEIHAIKDSMQAEIRSVNDKIMTTRYIIGVGLGIIVLLITIFKFIG